MFDALDFLAELTQHIPPKRLQLIRRYGLYASRTKGRLEQMPWVAQRAPGAQRPATSFSESTVSMISSVSTAAVSITLAMTPPNGFAMSWEFIREM